MRVSKRFSRVLVLLAVVMAFGVQGVFAGEVDWKNFSKNLVAAIKSDNEGLRRSAMNMIIKHGTKLDVDQAVFDVVRIFRNSDNQKERQLALITLYKMENNWSMGFLKRHLKFEENPAIKHQIAAIILEYYGNDDKQVALK